MNRNSCRMDLRLPPPANLRRLLHNEWAISLPRGGVREESRRLIWDPFGNMLNSNELIEKQLCDAMKRNGS